MSFNYVRKYYGVPAKRGMKVLFTRPGQEPVRCTIVSASHYLKLRQDDTGGRFFVHPQDEHVTYLTEETKR